MNNNQQKQESLLLASPLEITNIARDVGLYKVSKPPFVSFMSAVMAGAFIALGFIFYITTQTGFNGVDNWGLVKLVGGIVFSTGLMLVVVCGSDLFTSSTLLSVARVSGQLSTFSMLKNWVIVYLGNLVGALVCVALIWFSGQTMVAKGQWGLVVLNASLHKLEHSFIEAFCLGILCNIMVCLGVWLSYAGKTLIDKMLVLILPIALFVSSGFEHCVANMFMIPLGIITHDFSSAAFWLSINQDPMAYNDLTTYNFIIDNLIPVTLGNIVGGAIFIGLFNWYMNTYKPKYDR